MRVKASLRTGSFRDQRCVPQLAAAAAIEQERQDIAMQRLFDARVAANIHRRTADGRFNPRNLL